MMFFPNNDDSVSRRPFQIIIVDNSPTVRKIVETCLKREGFVVQGFPDGVEAMRHLIQPNAHIPDLVFLDIDLPKMNGYQVALAFKEKPHLSHIPIVFISCYNGVVDRLKTRLAGGKGHIAKPFTTQTIIKTAKHYTLLLKTTLEKGA